MFCKIFLLSVKRSEKGLSSKGSFCPLLQPNCSSLWLKECENSWSYQIVKQNNFEGVW